jgi:hypothetical protein
VSAGHLDPYSAVAALHQVSAGEAGIRMLKTLGSAAPRRPRPSGISRLLRVRHAPLALGHIRVFANVTQSRRRRVTATAVRYDPVLVR